MKSPKDKPKQKPKNLGNFARKEEKKFTPKADILGNIIDYIEKDAKAFAKDPIGGLNNAAYNLVGQYFDKGAGAIQDIMDGKGNVLQNVADVSSNVLGAVSSFSPRALIGKAVSEIASLFPQAAMSPHERAQRENAKLIRYVVKDPKFRQLIEDGVRTGITKDEYVNHITNGETPTFEEFKRKKLESVGISGELLNDDLQGAMNWQNDLMANSTWSKPMTPVEIAMDTKKVNAQDIIMPGIQSFADMYFDMGGQGKEQRPVKLIVNNRLDNLGEYRNNERTDKGYEPRIHLNLANIEKHKLDIEDDRYDKTRYFNFKTGKEKSAKPGFYGDGVIAHEMQHYLDHNENTYDPNYLIKPYNYYYKQLLEQKAHAAEASAEWRLANKRYPFKDKDIDGVYETYLRKIKEESSTQKPMPKELFKVLFRTVADNKEQEPNMEDDLKLMLG